MKTKIETNLVDQIYNILREKIINLEGLKQVDERSPGKRYPSKGILCG